MGVYRTDPTDEPISSALPVTRQVLHGFCSFGEEKAQAYAKGIYHSSNLRGWSQDLSGRFAEVGANGSASIGQEPAAPPLPSEVVGEPTQRWLWNGPPGDHGVPGTARRAARCCPE